MGLRSTFNNLTTNVKSFFKYPSYLAEARVNVEKTGYIKAFVSNDFLYKPPYGYPRMVDIPTIRALSKSSYVFMVTSTIVDGVASIDWDIVPKEKSEPDKDETDEEIVEDYHKPQIDLNTVKHIKEVKEFFNNPNGNEESFEYLIRAVVRDILEIDAGVWVKVFNKAGKMVQLFARDGGTFLKNPDIHGYLGNKAEYITPIQFTTEKDKENHYDTVYKTNAAYFQYGWVAMMPIPFGRREIVYMMRNPRSDSIYGRSPVEILQDVIQTLIYGATFNLDYYINNNMPDGVIQLMGANQEQINAFRERFEQQFKKQDSWGNWRKIFHKFPISNQEVKFTPFSLKPADMQIISQQQWFSKLVWACFGVTPSELGFTENSNRATELVQSRVFRRKAIKPLIKVLEYHINTQIMPEFGYDDIEFKFNDYDLTEDIERHKLFEVQLRNNIKTINEVREDMGLYPIEGGDKIQGTSSPEEEWGNESQFNNEEESDIREQFGLEKSFKKKSLETTTPLTPKENEKPDKELKKDLLTYLRNREELIMEEIKKIYESNKLAEVKDFEDLWQRLMKNLKSLFVSSSIKPLVDKFTTDFYIKGMETTEKEFAQNFFPDEKALEFLKDYNFDMVKNMTDELSINLKAILQRSFLNNKPLTETKAEVTKLFNNNEVRAKAIVRTEKARASNYGRLEGAKQSKLIKGKSILNPMNEKTSPLCKRMMKKYADKTITLDTNFKDDKTGQSWNAPPFHVNCRTSLITPRIKEAN